MPLINARLRRKLSTKRLKQGNVPFEGQELTIHIHKGEWMKLQKVNQFEFTVRTPGPHFEEPALATASPRLAIKEGHTYRVRLNADDRNPEIAEVLIEVIEGDTEPGEPEPA